MPRLFPTIKNFTEVATLAASGGFSKMLSPTVVYTNMTSCIKCVKEHDRWQGLHCKLDGVGPKIPHPPPTSSNSLNKKKREKNYTLHVTPDMCHLACDMWHMTCDIWHMTCDTWWGEIILLKVHLPSCYGLGVKAFWRFWGKGWLRKWID